MIAAVLRLYGTFASSAAFLNGTKTKRDSDMTTIVIVVLLVLLLGGGGYWGRGRYW